MKEYKKWLKVFLTVSALFIVTLTVASIREVAVHNTAALYGQRHDYSQYNLIIVLYELMK